MTDTLRITCRDCDGSGVITVAHRTGDPQLEAVGPCQHPSCEGGQVEVDGHEVDELVGAARFVLWASSAPAGVTPGAVSRLRKALVGMGVAP